MKERLNRNYSLLTRLLASVPSRQPKKGQKCPTRLTV
jgi:hypothetical protein